MRDISFYPFYRRGSYPSLPIFHEGGLGHRAAYHVIPALPQHLPPEVGYGRVQAKFPVEKEQSAEGNARLACLTTARPGLGLFPLLPMAWQMDVPRLRFNHENQDNTQGLPHLPGLLTSDPSVFFKSWDCEPLGYGHLAFMEMMHQGCPAWWWRSWV